MAREFVWAINEDGTPVKCFALPENRGKGKCNHRFHAEQGETRDSFLEKMSFNPSDVFKKSETKMVRMPNYEQKVSRIIKPMDTRNITMVDVAYEALENNPYFSNPFEGTDYEIKDGGVDPEDEHARILNFKFTTQDGEVIERSISIPEEDELGRIWVNGTPYRNVPTFMTNKLGVNMTNKGNLVVKDKRDNTIIFSENNKDTCNILVKEDNGDQKWHNDIPLSEIQKALNNEDSILSENEINSLKKLHPVAVRRLNEEGGLEGLKKLPPDDLNDLRDRRVWTYKDRVNYMLGREFRTMDSNYKRMKKKGLPYDFNMSKIDNNIRSRFVDSSNAQLADDFNPIASLCQSQRISWYGEGGRSLKSLPKGARLPHESYKDFVDYNDVSLGGKVGVTVGSKAFINENGSLTPDKKRVTGSDFIPYLEHSDPNRASMAISQMRQACPIVGGEDPITSTKGWDKIKGSKLGVNMTTAYVPMAGVWEDAVVISESTAKKMTTRQSTNYDVLNKNDEKLEIGLKVKRGDFIAGQQIKNEGVIKSIQNGRFEVESVYPMTVGDKVSGRHGNKGVVSKIVPDSEMPIVDGKPADIVMSPIGVAGRSNLGQIYEVNNGDFDKKSTIEYNGRKYEGTGGTQFVMRVNQIAEKKLSSNDNRRENDGEFKTRFGEMENLVMTQNNDRLDVLNYIQNQEKRVGNNKLHDVLKAIGVELKPAE